MVMVYKEEVSGGGGEKRVVGTVKMNNSLMNTIFYYCSVKVLRNEQFCEIVFFYLTLLFYIMVTFGKP